jgi:hypothetical protein
MSRYPLMDIEQAIKDATYHVESIAEIVGELLHASGGTCPVEAEGMLRQVADARAAIARILPASMQTELAMEKIRHADAEAYWTPC